MDHQNSDLKWETEKHREERKKWFISKQLIWTMDWNEMSGDQTSPKMSPILTLMGENARRLKVTPVITVAI